MDAGVRRDGHPLVNLRTGASTEHVVVGRAEKGDIFRVVDREGDWFAIELFTPARRYVYAAPYVYPLGREDLIPGHRMALPDSAALVHAIYHDIVAARARAQREATEILPAALEAERHAYLRRIIADRVILETLHIRGLQPALYGDLVEQADAAGW